jgi:pimeloyl-ACP methyl ester carboxylesterase
MQMKSLFSKVPFVTRMVSINQKQYEVHISKKEGKPAILFYGLSTLMRRTLSDNFYSHFSVYTSDLYWDRKTALENPEGQLTTKKIINDIKDMATQLDLEEYVICGHSTFGIIAFEAAKHDPRIAGVLMVGSPPDWNQHTWQTARKTFDDSASHDRKENDKARRAHYELVKIPGENECSINGYIRDTARYWKNFTHSDEFLKKLWEGLEADNDMFNEFFDHTLPAHKHEEAIEKVTCPVLLVGGPYDYDCIPIKLWSEAKQPAIFEMKECPESGQWPNFEDAETFDKHVLEWAKTLIFKKITQRAQLVECVEDTVHEKGSHYSF